MKKTVANPATFLFFLFSEQNSSIYNFIFLHLLWKQNYLRPGLTVYKQISFFEFYSR